MNTAGRTLYLVHGTWTKALNVDYTLVSENDIRKYNKMFVYIYTRRMQPEL